jgi:serine/threonine protein kinase
LIKQLCSAVFYFHTEYRLAHLDIKPDNLVFNDSNQLALIDLGHTEKIGAKINHATGTSKYRPEEIETGAAYQVAPADIYGLAMTILVIMIQDLPFGKVSRATLNRLYTASGTRASFFRILYGSFRDVDERHPEEVQELLYRCLNPNPAERPGIHDFLDCAWIVDAPETLDANLTHEFNTIMGLKPHP